MKNFMSDNILLQSRTAQVLYHTYASKLPILDFCVKAENEYSNIARAFLLFDEKKLLAMRLCGVQEKYITGDASDYEKFREFCRIIPMLAGNPIYVLSHLELSRAFLCDLTICKENCDEIWNRANDLFEKGWSIYFALEKNNVRFVCEKRDITNVFLEKATTVQSKENYPLDIFPAFCPDKLFDIEKKNFCEYLDLLGKLNNQKITDLSSLALALKHASDRFSELGCRTSLLSIDDSFVFSKPNPYRADIALKKALSGSGEISLEEAVIFKNEIIYLLCREYKRCGYVMQVHLTKKAGSELNSLFEYLKGEGVLPSKILISCSEPYICESGLGGEFYYSCNSMRISEFAEKCALGSLVENGFCSSPTALPAYHEYFRRSVCNTLGEIAQAGLFPFDFEALAELVCDICYNNGKNLFGLK